MATITPTIAEIQLARALGKPIDQIASVRERLRPGDVVDTGAVARATAARDRAVASRIFSAKASLEIDLESLRKRARLATKLEELKEIIAILADESDRISTERDRRRKTGEMFDDLDQLDSQLAAFLDDELREKASRLGNEKLNELVEKSKKKHDGHIDWTEIKHAMMAGNGTSRARSAVMGQARAAGLEGPLLLFSKSLIAEARALRGAPR